jgi:predicted RecB family nuclease
MAGVRTITDLPKIDEEKARLLEAAGITTLTQLAETPLERIMEITGLEGMDAFIARGRAANAVERGVELSAGGKLVKQAKQAFNNGGKQASQMKIGSIISQFFRKL